MNQKDLIKYGLLALGAYLIYKYVQDHGGIEGMFGSLTGGDVAGTKAVADAAADKANVLVAAAAANPNDAVAAAAAKKAVDDAAALKAIADKTAAEGRFILTTPLPMRVACWNGTYAASLANCPAAPAPAIGKTPAEIAAETAQAAKTQLYNSLVGQGVDPSTAQTYIDHCGANGQCDATYYLQMLQQAALGVPNMMRLTDVGGILFNADQWQYYRAQGGGADLDVGDIFTDRTARIHASEFNAGLNNFLAGGGISGWGMGAVRYTPAWLM